MEEYEFNQIHISEYDLHGFCPECSGDDLHMQCNCSASINLGPCAHCEDPNPDIECHECGNEFPMTDMKDEKMTTHIDTLNLLLAESGAMLAKVRVAESPLSKDGGKIQAREYLIPSGEAYEADDVVMVSTQNDGVFTSGVISEILDGAEINFQNNIEYRFVLGKAPTEKAAELSGQCVKILRELSLSESRRKIKEAISELPEEVTNILPKASIDAVE